MTEVADYAEWRKANPPPDLQALVAKWNGYPNIPPEAWAEFDAARDRWEEARKLRLKA